jgi:hypothetical protein
MNETPTRTRDQVLDHNDNLGKLGTRPEIVEKRTPQFRAGSSRLDNLNVCELPRPQPMYHCDSPIPDLAQPLSSSFISIMRNATFINSSYRGLENILDPLHYDDPAAWRLAIFS